MRKTQISPGNETGGSTDFLARKPIMDGVNRFWNMAFLETWAGRKDAKQDQIFKKEDGATSPWVQGRCEAKEAYTEQVYPKVLEIMKPMYEKAEELLASYRYLMSPPWPEGSDESASVKRHQYIQSRVEPQKELLLTQVREELAVTGNQIRILDEMLQHHLSGAEDILNQHLARYWRGVRKVIGREAGIYPVPEPSRKGTQGRLQYESNLKMILMEIDTITGKGEN